MKFIEIINSKQLANELCHIFCQIMNLPVGILTSSDKTAALFPEHGSRAIGLGESFFRFFARFEASSTGVISLYSRSLPSISTKTCDSENNEKLEFETM